MEAVGDERGKLSAGLRHAGTSQFTCTNLSTEELASNL